MEAICLSASELRIPMLMTSPHANAALDRAATARWDIFSDRPQLAPLPFSALATGPPASFLPSPRIPETSLPPDDPRNNGSGPPVDSQRYATF